MKHAIAISAVALLALMACQKKTTTETAAATGTAAPAVATAPEVSTGPSTPPPRKPGLWAQTISTAGMQQTTKLCLDAATEKKLAWSGAQTGKQTCAQQTITPSAGGGWAFHSVCASPSGGTVTSDGMASGDFGSHYKVEATSTTTGGPMPQANGVHKMSLDAAWQGPCPADMKPGDMQLPGGVKMNLAEMGTGKGMKDGK
ncbi:MAG: hypothetical protein JWR47_2184 [Phenylobacterium sp.]|nr:hypothetical protein [Phenylobacterium sp.]